MSEMIHGLPAETPFKDIRRYVQAWPLQMREDVNYFQTLASNTRTNIDEWPFLQIMKGVPGGNRRAINKAFFAYSGGLPNAEKVEAKADPVTPEIGAQLKAAEEEVERGKAERIRRLRGEIIGLQRNLDTWNTRVADEIKKLWDIETEISALQNRPSDYMANEVRELLAEGFWKFVKHDRTNSTLQLATANDVVLSERQGGKEYSVNMGRYLACLDVKRMALRVKPHERNIYTDSNYFHTYIDKEGVICWGNAQGTATKLLASGQVKRVMMLLESLLTSYSPDTTPWASLFKFRDRRLNDGEGAEEPSYSECGNCGNTDDNCTCCDSCGRDLDNDIHAEDCPHYDDDY